MTLPTKGLVAQWMSPFKVSYLTQVQGTKSGTPEAFKCILTSHFPWTQTVTSSKNGILLFRSNSPNQRCRSLRGGFIVCVDGLGGLFTDVCLLACFLAFCPAAMSRPEGTATRNGRRWTDLPVVAEQPEPFLATVRDVRQITDSHTEQPWLTVTRSACQISCLAE